MKKYLFDTSVIVAGSIEQHPAYNTAFPWLVAARQKKIGASISSHCLAELFSVLTRLPIYPALTPQFVQSFIDMEIARHFQVISLSSLDYKKALKNCSRRNIIGGTVYDALHMQACLKKRLNGIVTFNDGDFHRLTDPSGIEIINPTGMGP